MNELEQLHQTIFEFVETHEKQIKIVTAIVMIIAIVIGVDYGLL